MPVPESIRKEADALPASLRVLLEAELAAGNEIAEVGHSFPAPPAGAYFKLTKPLLSRPGRSGDGISYYDRNNSLYSGEITDANRFYFILEPPRQPEPEPDMDEIRARRATVTQTNTGTVTTETTQSLLRRFESSMVMDFDKWHDGTGYDLDALRAMSPAEKQSAEAMVLRNGERDWRDIEALACLDTPAARTALQRAMNSPNPEVRNAVTRHAPGLIPDSVRTTSLVQGLESANFFGGLTQTLDQVAGYHPPLIVEALMRGVVNRSGDVAVHFAAMLCYIYGKASEPFDMEQRPFFLQFNTENRGERETMFRELCEKIGVAACGPGGKSAAITPSPGEVDPEYTVTVDPRGEMLTYCEPNRSAHVVCIFGEVSQIRSRTLSDWYYPLGRRTEKMRDEEREIILARIADYCAKNHGMIKLTFET